MLNVVILSGAFLIVMLSVIVLSVVLLSVVMINVVVLDIKLACKRLPEINTLAYFASSPVTEKKVL
jgi:hypothetical protein